MLDWIKDKNFYISYAGNVTFKNADNLRYALSNTPLDRLLIETDSPYLAPVPVRGKKNMPANVSYTGEYVAEFLNIPYNTYLEIKYFDTFHQGFLHNKNQAQFHLLRLLFY